MNKVLSYYYLSPASPAYLASANQLLRTVRKKHPNISLKQVMAYLEQQKSHQLHKKHRKTKQFKRRVSRCVPIGHHTDHQCDLADMRRLSKSNSGANWILVCVDVLSRMVDATPVKSKSAADMVGAFKRIYEQHKILPFPWRIYSDNGKEFHNSSVREYLEKNFVQQLKSTSEAKASVAERFIRDLKSRLYKHFTHTDTQNYTKILPNIINSFNRTPCRKHGMLPIEINKENWVNTKQELEIVYKWFAVTSVE